MIRIDASSATPPYEQVRVEFARLIGQRELAVGAKLPTVRQLAADLGLAVNTVARAYRELEVAGLIETRGRGGTFVAAGGDQVAAHARAAATEYATRSASLGLGRDEALAIVTAALDANESFRRS